MNSIIRIGFAGPIDPGSSRHAEWIARGVKVARDSLNARHGGRVRLVARDDRASGAGGDLATRQLLAQGVDVLAGYFSSAAAAAAVPLASSAHKPLVIAGATVDSLTEAPGVYRVCDGEEAYAAWISDIVTSRHLAPVRIVHQPTLFGERMSRVLGARGVGVGDGMPLTILFLGQADFVYGECMRDASGLRHCPNILLTDDCQHLEYVNRLALALGSGVRILVAGFRQKSGRGGDWADEAAVATWGASPGAFFFETIAAIEIATHLACGHPLQPAVPTVFGPLQFDANGEGRPRRFQLYRLDEGRLRAILDVHTSP